MLVLRAVRGGWSVPARALLVAGLLAAAALTLVPPFGSSDHLSYAAYGRMLVTGHNPYTTTPAQLAALGDPVARAVQDWSGSPSVYGPLATAIQGLASLVGGTSVRLTVFVLGLANLAAFAVTALLLHRMTRHHPVQQLRAALLWACNPLLLQVLVAGAHVDGQAVVFGVAAVAVMFGPWPRRVRGARGAEGGTGGRSSPKGGLGGWVPPGAGGLGVAPPASRALLAGVLVGLGFAVKVTAALAGVGLAIALMLILGRALAAARAAAGGARRGVRGDGGSGGGHRRAGDAQAVVAGERHGVDRVTVAGDPDDHSSRGRRNGRDRHREVRGHRAGRGARGAAHPRARPASGLAALTAAFALALAWLFAWPYVLPWYDALAGRCCRWSRWCRPAVEAVGWLLLARTAALGFGYLPARQTDAALPPGLGWLQPVVRHGVTRRSSPRPRSGW